MDDAPTPRRRGPGDSDAGPHFHSRAAIQTQAADVTLDIALTRRSVHRCARRALLRSPFTRDAVVGTARRSGTHPLEATGDRELADGGASTPYGASSTQSSLRRNSGNTHGGS